MGHGELECDEGDDLDGQSLDLSGFIGHVIANEPLWYISFTITRHIKFPMGNRDA